jgi:hypothetical protein
MSDVNTDVGLVLANVLDETFVVGQHDEVVKQLASVDQAFQQLEAKRNELLIHKYKLEGALAACQVFLNVLRAEVAEVEPAAKTE